MKFKDLVEGKEYKIDRHTVIYTVKDGLLYNMTIKRYSSNPTNVIAMLDFKELPWKPEIYKRYFYISVGAVCGYESHINYNDVVDTGIFSRAKAYRTEEEVIAAVKELGWDVE